MGPKKRTEWHYGDVSISRKMRRRLAPAWRQVLQGKCCTSSLNSELPLSEGTGRPGP